MRVRLSDEVIADIAALEERLAAEVSPDFAVRYVGRLLEHIVGLDAFPERNAVRPALGVAVRALIHEGRYTVAYRVGVTEVSVLALFGSGQEWRRLKESP